MVEFVDGSVVAQMGEPDMRTPIQYALTYPSRANGLGNHLDLTATGRMHFARPDRQVFTALSMGERVAREGGSSGAVLNAANEVAVAAFLDRKISLPKITELVSQALDEHQAVHTDSLEDLMAADAWARRKVHDALGAN
jgi:1-deoxy-D-xylulose-5-phosphate reductoisomerase